MRKKYNPGQNNLAKHNLFSFFQNLVIFVFSIKIGPARPTPKSMLLYLDKRLCINMFICANNIDIGGKGGNMILLPYILSMIVGLVQEKPRNGWCSGKISR